MRSFSLTRLVGLLLLICALFQLGSSQDNSSDTTTQTCPAYRFLDTNNPDTPIYGAPDGCRCFLGLSGLNCGYCEDDEPCQLQQSNSVCRKDFAADATAQTYVAYKCRMYNKLGSLFTNGKASFYMDLNDNTVSLSLFDTRTVNDNRTVDCTFGVCEFAGKNTTCESAQCSCNTDQCNPLVQQLVDRLSGKPAQIQAEPIPPVGREDHRVTVWLDGAPFVEASCTARACASGEDTDDTTQQGGGNMEPMDISDFFGDSEDEEETVITQSQEGDSGSASSTTLALIIICVMIGMAVAVGLALVPFLFATHSYEDVAQYTPDDNSVPQEPTRKHILQFRNISRTIELKGDALRAYGQKKKVILKDISGSVESGTMLGIMGQSGAGKSSLLNVLAAVETTRRATVSGQILLNGQEPSQGYRRAVAYVHQDDALYGTLTVRECIEYSALMRLPKTMSTNEKEALVWKTLDELHLTDIAHNRIGTTGHASVSGGQRKRVSIGMELVAMPTVLALDEPTSGLDSSAANKIMNVLSDLASRNRIVILSIHQPSMKSFNLMDQIMLLGGGRVVYNGTPSEVRNHLEDRGFSCPEDETVADYMLDVVSDEANLKVLKNSGTNSKQEATVNAKDDESESNGFEELYTEGGSFLNEIVILFARTGKDIFRNMELFLMQVGISILVAVFGGAIFNDVSNDLAGFQNRMGAFYFSLSFFGFASFSSMDIFVKERHIFERETGAKMYRAFSYFAAKTVFDMFVLRVIPVTIFSFVFYWMMGLSSDFDKFMVYWATMILFNVCAGIISIFISIAAQTVGQANLIAVVWFLIMLLFGGFLVNIDSMASWYAWLKYLSIFYYTFEILITNELSGLLLRFDAPGFPTLPVYGEVFVETLGMDVEHQTRNMLCLCCIAAGYSLLAYLFLLRRVPPSATAYFQKMQKETGSATGSRHTTTHESGSINGEGVGSPSTPQNDSAEV